MKNGKPCDLWVPHANPKLASRPQRRVRSKFYQSQAWRMLRYQALKLYGSKCACCGRKPPGVLLHVDHVKPVRNFPELALEIENLQILCEDCNIGKGAWDETDWRK